MKENNIDERRVFESRANNVQEPRNGFDVVKMQNYI